MEIIKLNNSHLSLLSNFCKKCENLGWENNSSIKKLKFDMVYDKGGAFLAGIEKDEIVSVAGYYPFFELDDSWWRIFFRSATLPKTGPNKGLHRGTGLKGRMFIDKFIENCGKENLYLTTNIENSTYSNITRYHKSLELESKLPDSYINKVDIIYLYGQQQAIWKLDVDKYLERTRK